MKSRLMRRSGRQIPEWMVLSVVLSLSVAFGMPVAARLRAQFPQSSKVLWFFAGVGIGFLILVALWLIIGALALLVVRVWQWFARQKK